MPAVAAALGRINVPSDMTVGQPGEIRSVSNLPVDLYVESPDGAGGVVRGQEIGDIVPVAAPIYTKFGLRNSRPLYPSGIHLENEVIAIAREKVRQVTAPEVLVHPFRWNWYTHSGVLVHPCRRAA